MEIKKGDILKDKFKKSAKYSRVFEILENYHDSGITYIYSFRVRVKGTNKGVSYGSPVIHHMQNGKLYGAVKIN